MVHTYYGLFIDDAPIRMYIHNTNFLSHFRFRQASNVNHTC